MSINKNINLLTNKYKNFLVGFSGGLDSTVLLYKLNTFKKKKNINIRAIHINHNINYVSIKWEKHCKKICKKLKINLIIKKMYLRKEKSNIEHKARKKRYFFFHKNLLKNEILLTGHHKNDQCESILLSIKRGSGLKGLSGIKKYIKINKKIIIRPFLNIEKNKLIKYAKKHKLIWINDLNNYNNNYDRNFFRLLIIPKILKRWPYFLHNIERSANICYKQEILLNKLLKNKFKKILYKKKAINLKYLINYDKEEIFFLLRKWLETNNKKMLSNKLINLLWINILKLKNKNNKQLLNFKKYSIYIHKKIIFIVNKIKKITQKKFLWDKKKYIFNLPNKLGYLFITKKKEKNNLNLIRKPYKNEKIYIKFRIKKKIKLLNNKKLSIKKIWQKYKVLPWERNTTPIIFYNKKAILSPNLFITKEGQPNNLPSWNINIKKKLFRKNIY